MNPDRVALFIDGPNLYATGKALGVDVDFKRLLKYYGDAVIGAYYYTATMSTDEGNDAYSSIRPLIDWLSYNEYTVVTKPAKTFTDDNGRTKVKGNMDCEMTVDAMTLAFNKAITRAVFFTGDGDFKALIIALQAQGVRCTVVSTITTNPAMCADELRRAANTFVDLVEIVGSVCRENLSQGRVREPVTTQPRSRYASAKS